MDTEVIGRRFAGRAGILTGAASGIGRAAALRLTAEGARLLLVDRDAEGLKETVRLVGEQGGRAGGAAAAHPGDVADEEAVRTAVAAAKERYGAIDLLVNVAGFHKVVPLEEVTVDYWHRQFAVNALGTALFCREALPHLVESGGVVVNTASTSATHAHPYMTAYAASKGAVLAFTQSLAAEVWGRGVRVLAVSPGGVATPLADSVAFPEGTDGSYYARITPPRGMGRPEDIAAAIAFAASEDGAFVRGVELRVDGGSHA
ncbi:SDR family NAD(P)-dependent oxidoreductase [Nocardiopsis suaedae]|uniref:SDR family NAD(P)-dependent oxidoreductase n=1 Tax=Nocardiopsis suaedae TaxID=3018444 RepID=A0ABT4TM83_9ACTN|nr:SDR family oxidoreductase [Nocardiopsis suaedae]MDA2805798.1 SDR family NAD(P)-dependent oxidoreductase [Nocardiopsis suaedae]